MGGKRRELYIIELKDYIQLLKIAFHFFQEYNPDDKRTINQIKKVGDYCISIIQKKKKITKPLLGKIADYTISMKTFDRKQIQPLGRDLLAFSKTIK